VNYELIRFYGDTDTLTFVSRMRQATFSVCYQKNNHYKC